MCPTITISHTVLNVLFSSVQLLSHVQLFATPWTAACQASLSITNSRNLRKLMPIESVMPSNHLIFCCPLLLPSISPSNRVFSNELVTHAFNLIGSSVGGGANYYPQVWLITSTQ